MLRRRFLQCLIASPALSCIKPEKKSDPRIFWAAKKLVINDEIPWTSKEIDNHFKNTLNSAFKKFLQDKTLFLGKTDP